MQFNKSATTTLFKAFKHAYCQSPGSLIKNVPRSERLEL